MRRYRVRLLLIAVPLLLTLRAVHVLDPVERGVMWLLRPVHRFFSGALPQGESSVSGDLGLRLRELETQVSRLLTENILLKEDRRESVAVASQTGFLERRNLIGRNATIIGKSPEGDDQRVILDRGSEVGIAQGQPVITDEGVFIGTILEAEPGRSIAALVTDPRSTVAAEVENAPRSPGLVSGQHGLTLIMEFIPQNEPVTKDQAVVTSAIDERIPANLPLGVISEVHYTTGDLFQRASLRPLIDVRRVRYVSVIIEQ